MANYCQLENIKRDLDITGDENNDVLQAMIAQVKTFIDNLCDRQFDTTTETRYFDGAGSVLFIDDMVSITSLKLDEDGDGTYEVTMSSSDYVLYPLNTTPKMWIEISSNSNYSGFANGIKKGVEIAATWGYGTTVPADVQRAASIQVMRWFKRCESAFADVIGAPEMGQFIMYKALDPDVQLILQPYRRRSYP